MTEKDSDYFFGRVRRDGRGAQCARQRRPTSFRVLLGNSGVGKSSLAQAGVLACARRQSLAGDRAVPAPWPAVFRDSRGWCFLTLRPGAEPIKALVEAFLDTWQFDAGDPARIKQRNEWVELLLDENKKTSMRGSARRDRAPPQGTESVRSRRPSFFTLIKARSSTCAPRSASAAASPSRWRMALGEARLRALMSLRADFFGALQNDESLYAAHRLISVPPLRETQLREVVSRPAELLSAASRPIILPPKSRGAPRRNSAKDAGALPLLSYLLDDMWTADGQARRRHAAPAAGRHGARRRARGACQRIPLASSAVGGCAAARAHAQACDRARGWRADAATRSALGVHGRGMAAGERACRPSEPPPGDGNAGGWRDLCARSRTKRFSGAGRNCGSGSQGKRTS